MPTIVGELLAGVVIGASGFHLLIPPSTGAHLNAGFVNAISSLASIPPEAVPDLYFETFPSLQAVATLGLYALLFLTGLESELEELVAVGAQAFTVAMASIAPAAPSRCPVMDLVELTFILSACTRKRLRMAKDSFLSLNGVEVP